MSNIDFVSMLFMDVYDEITEIIGSDHMPELFDYEGVVINQRLKRALARCIQKPMTYGPPTYRFDVSPLFFKLDYENQRNVVAHEWIHAMCRYGERHGAQFKYYMNILNKHGFNVSVTESYSNLGLESPNEEPKYILKCIKCGRQFTRNRMCDVIKYSNRYQHTGCGGSLQRIR